MFAGMCYAFSPISRSLANDSCLATVTSGNKQTSSRGLLCSLGSKQHNKPQVEVYYAAWDPNSNQALKFFQDNHIVVNAYDIEMDADAAMRKKQLAPDFMGIPLVIINDIKIRGVDEQKYQDALHPIKPPR